MDKTSDLIALDPESELVLIPPSKQHKFALSVSLWDGAPQDAFHAFVQHQVSSGGLARICRMPGRGDTVLPVTVQLVPRPDNDYNPKAISVAAPPECGGTDHERHLGYMYDRNLTSLGGPLRGLASVAERPVGCHAFIELHKVHIDEYWPEERDNYGLCITASDEVVYSVGGLRLLMPWWEDLQKMAVEYTRAIRPDQILPFIGHWVPWKAGAREELAGRTRQEMFPVTLRAEKGELLAYYEDLLLACLLPSHRDFFDPTLQRVRELGGTATAYAEDFEGALKVFVEDSSPRL
ncbi:hypothetical protein ACFQ6V_09450 [Streptomyces roseifaciens]